MSQHIRLHVIPRARRSEVIEMDDMCYRIKVTEPRERGRATRAAIRALAEHLGLRPSSLSLLSGKTSREKLVEIVGENDRPKKKS